MITTIFLDNFRGLRVASFDKLPQLTILTGPNGMGKSSLLEAFFIGASADSGKALGTVVARRGTWDGAKYLFRTERPEALIEIGFCDKNVTGRRLVFKRETDVPAEARQRLVARGALPPYSVITLRNSGQAPFQRVVVSADNNYDVEWLGSENGEVARPPDISACRLLVPGTLASSGEELNTIFSESVRKGRRQRTVELLRTLLPGLKDIELLTERDNRPILNLSYGDRAVPVSVAGDGIRELVRLAFELEALDKGVVLIEEPETFLHPAAMRASATAIHQAVRRKLQVILATHSIEFIDELIAQAKDEDLTNICLINLRLVDGELRTGRNDGQEIRLARSEIEADLR